MSGVFQCVCIRVGQNRGWCHKVPVGGVSSVSLSGLVTGYQGQGHRVLALGGLWRSIQCASVGVVKDRDGVIGPQGCFWTLTFENFLENSRSFENVLENSRSQGSQGQGHWVPGGDPVFLGEGFFQRKGLG